MSPHQFLFLPALTFYLNLVWPPFDNNTELKVEYLSSTASSFFDSYNKIVVDSEEVVDSDSDSDSSLQAMFDSVCQIVHTTYQRTRNLDF